MGIKRRARITREEVAKAGFTVGCPGCRAISRNAPAQNHTETCRKRLEEAITKQGGAGAKRIADGNVRFGNHVNKKRQAEAQEEEGEKRQRAQEEEGEKRQREDEQQEERQPRKQAKPNEQLGTKRPLEEEENGEGAPQKYQQLNEDEEGEGMEIGENELAIRAVQEETREQYWDNL